MRLFQIMRLFQMYDSKLQISRIVVTNLLEVVYSP